MKTVNTHSSRFTNSTFTVGLSPSLPTILPLPSLKQKKPTYIHKKTPNRKQKAFSAFPAGAKNCFPGIYKVSLTTPAIWLLKEALDMWLEPHYLPFHALVLPKLLLGTFKFQTVAQICLCKNWHINDLFSRDLFLNTFLFKAELLNFIILIFLFPHDSKEND